MSKVSLGQHVLVELYGCNSELLDNVSSIEQIMCDAAERSKATIINVSFHHFSPYGVSGVVVIQESHLAIHTWPEYGYAAIDVFTCGNTVDPWVAYAYLKEALQAESGSTMELKRGQTHLMTRERLEENIVRDEKSRKIQAVYKRNVWLTERDENIALSLRHKGNLLYSDKSEYQKIEVYDTYAYGKVLCLDSLIMCTEKDEQVYHEMMVHVPMLCHAEPKRVLIVGGGDGGTLREVLKHPCVESVVMVEIDAKVIEASKKHLPGLSKAFNNSKLDLLIQDAIKYVEDCAKSSFDVVIIDNSDPVGPSEGIFTRQFYENIDRILKEDGIMVAQSESPRFNTEVFKDLYKTLRNVFACDNVHPYLAYIPTYPTGMWSFAFCSKSGIHPILDLSQPKVMSFVQGNSLNYYNLKIHSAAFAQPNFVCELLEEKTLV